MRLVADAGPLHYLVLTGDIELLPRLFAKILTPERVRDELAHAQAPEAVRAWIVLPPQWLEIRPVESERGGTTWRRSTPASATLSRSPWPQKSTSCSWTTATASRRLAGAGSPSPARWACSTSRRARVLWTLPPPSSGSKGRASITARVFSKRSWRSMGAGSLDGRDHFSSRGRRIAPAPCRDQHSQPENASRLWRRDRRIPRMVRESRRCGSARDLNSPARRDRKASRPLIVAELDRPFGVVRTPHDPRRP